MDRLFKASEQNPYHLSVGAVLMNDKGEICSHYFEKVGGEVLNGKFKAFEKFYILMRETVKDGETIEAAVARGLREEFGATGKIVRFLGTLISSWPIGEVAVQKTTLYFLVNLTSIDLSMREKEDLEGTSEITWLPKEELLKRMTGQKERLGNDSLDESEILTRL
jgi:NADH pyrophosphatase NudC (nudix superfamily)